MKKLLLILFVPLLLYPTTYYVKSSGDDTKNGLSDANAWATLQRIRVGVYVAGDSILLNRGDTFEGEIIDTLISSNGALPIVIGAYGTGAKPILYGDLRGRTWTQVYGYPHVWKTYLGAGHNEFNYHGIQYYGGAWTATSAPQTKNSNPANWAAFYAGMEANAGRMGKGGQVDLQLMDTLFYHPYGDGNYPATSDSIFFPRDRIISLVGSNNVIVRDLDLRNGLNGIQTNSTTGTVSGTFNDSIIIRAVDGKLFQQTAIMLRYANNSLIDSCRVDSCADTGIYLWVTNKCTVRRNLIMNITNAVTPVYAYGLDDSGIGMFINENNTSYVGGFNVVEYNNIHNVANALIDQDSNYKDTIRYNDCHNGRVVGSPDGTGTYVANNTFVLNGTTGSNGVNFSQYGIGSTVFRDNTLDSIRGYAFWCYDNDSSASGATINIMNNTVTISATPNLDYENFDANLSGSNIHNGIVADSNHFFGIGNRFIFKDTIYTDISTYTLHSSYSVSGGYESHGTLNDTTVANADTIYFYYTTNDTVNIYGINDTIQVLVSDTAGVPISGVAVTFARTTAPAGAIGQAITTTSTTTDESGLATTILTLGSKAGNYVVTATSTGLGGSPVTITTNAYRSGSKLFKKRY